MKRYEIKQLIEEAYIEVLLEADEEETPDEKEEDVPDEEGGEEVVPGPEDEDAEESPEVKEKNTDKMIARFPTLKGVLIRLMTREYEEFVKSIDWVSPRPTTFRVNLQNDQEFNLQWTGKDFQATIAGKKYFLGTVDEFQQALDKLTKLYQQAPLIGAGAEGGEGDPFGAGGGGGEFPGEEGGGLEGGADGEEAFGGEEGGEFSDEPAADLDGEEIDFEAGEEPA